VEQLQDTTTTSVMEMLERSFATHGIPVTVRTGNRPQLVSEEFKEFVCLFLFFVALCSSWAM